MDQTTEQNNKIIYTKGERPLAVIASSSCADGYLLAKQFAENGYDLIIAAANPSVVEEAEDFKDLGIEAVSFQIDLSTPAGVEQFYKKIVASGRHVEAMVINSGLSVDLTNESVLALKVLKDMANQGRGHLLIASTVEEEDLSKTIEVLEKMAEGTGVDVVCLQPGNSEISFLKKLH